jgi:hypothetical protein
MDEERKGLFRRLFGEKRKKDVEEIYGDMMIGLRRRTNLLKNRDPYIGKVYKKRLENLFDMMREDVGYDVDNILLPKDVLKMIANRTGILGPKRTPEGIEPMYLDETKRTRMNAGIWQSGSTNVLSDEDILELLLRQPEIRGK